MSHHELGPLTPRLLTGGEPLELEGASVGACVGDFWAWANSDLVDNTQRGILAEWIVGLALQVDLSAPRVTWATFDLLTPEGVRVEVKSSAYLQSWGQPQLSRVSFNHAPRRGFDAETGVSDDAPRHHADVWVFALLAHTDKATVDPLDLDQWEFYVVPTHELAQRTRSQSSITLASLRGELGKTALTWSELRHAVVSAMPDDD